jgi:hypothetical protein
MKVSYVEGVANHNGPEPCGAAREGDVEALTGGRTGSVLSREIYALLRKQQVLRDADEVEDDGRQHRVHRHRKVSQNPAPVYLPRRDHQQRRGRGRDEMPEQETFQALSLENEVPPQQACRGYRYN